MRPDKSSKIFLAITRAKAKMYEFNIPLEDHIEVTVNVTDLFDITIGMVGDLSYLINTQENVQDSEYHKILFSAQYFDALLNSKLEPSLSFYLKILGSASYVLAGFPGSANVLIRDLQPENINANELEKILVNFIDITPIDIGGFSEDNPYLNEIREVSTSYNNFLSNGTNPDELSARLAQLRKVIYEYGNDRDLLLGDIINAICKLYLRESLWIALPAFSGLNIENWKSYIQSEKIVKKLWPAQILIGKEGVFSGNSAVIQMPTSAGKTKSISFIIRSSFYANRCKVATVVAPFRALCQEIYNNFQEEFSTEDNIYVNLVSDVYQNDFSRLVDNTFHILILTPEKLDYILRHNSELAQEIGLIVYDEGHLFDNNSRGAKYELLLTSLRQGLRPETQIILISAVLPNAQEIGEWLIGDGGKIVKGENLYPTARNISFVNWTQAMGRLTYRNEDDYSEEDFFVPRVLQRQKLQLRGRETRERSFPTQDSPTQIALALTCKLVRVGTVAIFTGRKDTAANILSELVDAFERGLALEKPSEFSNEDELNKLINFIGSVLGTNSTYYKASKIGLFAHHGSIPQGLRLSIEYSLSKDLIKAVVCTSTLAQGVNLPIRYLIISTTQQGADSINSRDFHNLMGRAGRSNKFTEGTIIFSDRIIYDLRHNFNEGWRWLKTLRLLDPKEQDLCRSRLLSLFDEMPINFDKETWTKNINSIKDEISLFLLNFLTELTDNENITEIAGNLAKNTLAYHQANDNEKKLLEEIFIEIGKDILTHEPDFERRKVFAKSILSLEKSTRLLEIIQQKINFINTEHNSTEILLEMFDILYNFCPSIHTSISPEKIFESIKMWINGRSFPEILNYLQGQKFGRRNATIELIVNECEVVFGFEGSLLIGSISELLELINEWNGANKDALLLLQKMLKYGLPTYTQINLYEIGFVDRKLCEEISTILNNQNIISETHLKIEVRNNRTRLTSIIDNYPSYFGYVFKNLFH